MIDPTTEPPAEPSAAPSTDPTDAAPRPTRRAPADAPTPSPPVPSAPAAPPDAPPDAPVVVVGAGLAGLACARVLAAAGVPVHVLEAADEVGGRVRTDLVEGFRLDRGFQVLSTAYPEARRLLALEALDPRPFYPGALVRHGGRFHRVADPFRRPLDALRGLGSPVGTLADKLRVAALRGALVGATTEEVMARPDVSTAEALREAGFSEAMVQRFFRPFLGGVFFDPALETSARAMGYVLRHFALGETVLPAAGMGAIPRQLARGLPEGAVTLGARVAAVNGAAPDGGTDDAAGAPSVRLADGVTLPAAAVVVATAASEAAKLLGAPPPPPGRSATCLYFVADAAPVAEPILMLDGDAAGPALTVAVPSAVAPSYAPDGRALVACTVPGDPPADDAALVAATIAQMTDWFGPPVAEWTHLATYRLAGAQPDQSPGALEPPARPARVAPGLYACGDHLAIASIDGALASGRRAAEAVLADRARG